MLDNQETIFINVPCQAAFGTKVAARFRLTKQSSFTYNGELPNGEVEDYMVTPERGAPVAVADNVTLDEDSQAIIRPLLNDIEPVSGPLLLNSITAPMNGSAAIVGSTILYTPSKDFAGNDNFIYTITNEIGKSASSKVSLTVNSINDAPTNVSLDSAVYTLTIADNDKSILIPTGTDFGAIRVDDADKNDVHLFMMYGMNVSDAVGVNNKRLQVLSTLNVPLSKPYVTFNLKAIDSGGLSISKPFTISIKYNTVPSPTEIQLSNDHLKENLAADTVVGKLQTNYAIGLNQNGPHTYSLVAGTGSDDNYRFTIIGKELHTKQSLDYEDKTPLSVRIRVVDGNKRSREQAFAIKIDNDSSEVIDSAPPRCAMSTQTLFDTTDAQIELSNVISTNPRPEGCKITGLMSVRVKNNRTSNISFVGYIDEENKVYFGERSEKDAAQSIVQVASQTGTAAASTLPVSEFALRVAGLDFVVFKAQIEYYSGRPSLRLVTTNICMPADWGGLCAPLAGGAFLVDSSGLKPTVNVKLPIPELNIGKSLAISSLEGELLAVAGGYEISAAGEFSLPKIKAGGKNAGCSLDAALTIYTDAQGNTVADLQAAAPAGADGLALREVEIGMQCEKGIPIDATGLQLSGVRGKLSLRPDSQYVELGITIDTITKLGPYSLASLDAYGRLLWDPDWGFDIGGTAKLLSIFEMSSAEARIRETNFSFKGEMSVVIAKGTVEINAWSSNGSITMTGSGKIQLGIRKGALWNGGESTCKAVGRTVCAVVKVFSDAWNWLKGWFKKKHHETRCNQVIDRVCSWVGVAIPPWNMYLPSVNGDFGKFTNGNWGVKGYFSLEDVAGNNARDLLSRLGVPKEFGFYADHQENSKLGNVTKYQLMTPPTFAAALQRYMALQSAAVSGASLDVAADPNIAILSENHALLQARLQDPALSAAAVISQVRVSKPSTMTFLLASNSVMTPSLIAPDGLLITPNNFNTPAINTRYQVSYTNSVIYEQFSFDANLNSLLPQLRLLPLAAIPGVTTVDIRMDGNLLWHNIPLLGSDSDTTDNPMEYVNIEPGVHTLSILPAGQATELISTTIDALPTLGYTALLAGNPAQVVVVDSKEKVFPTSDQNFVRFVHAADMDRTVNVLINGTPASTNLSFGEHTDYVALPTGVYKVEVKDAVTGVDLVTPRTNQSAGALAATIVLADINNGNYSMEYTGLIDNLFVPRQYAVYQVGGADVGNWQVDVDGDMSDPSLTLAVLAYGMPTQIKDVSATVSDKNQAAVSWGVVSEYAPTQITIYATPGEITSTMVYSDSNGNTVSEIVPQYSGIPVKMLEISDPSKLSGAISSATVNLDQLPSGVYHLWVDADDGVNPSVHAYARVAGSNTLATVTVDHSNDFPTTWSPLVTTTVDAEQALLGLTWDALTHPDINSYSLQLVSSDGTISRTQEGLSKVYNYDESGNPLGMAYVYGAFDNIEAGKNYTITIEAISEHTGKSVKSAPILVFINPGEYRLQTDVSTINFAPGEQKSLTINLVISKTLFYPYVSLGLNDALLPRGITLKFAGETENGAVLSNLSGLAEVQVSGASNEVFAWASDETGTAASTTLQISVASDVPAGTYPLIINGYNISDKVEKQVVTLVVGAGTQNYLYLPVVTNQ